MQTRVSFSQLEIVPTFVLQLDGKILPNAYAVVDVDGDDLHDFVFGSVTGTVAVYKVRALRLWASDASI
jgi:hypothetical protein